MTQKAKLRANCRFWGKSAAASAQGLGQPALPPVCGPCAPRCVDPSVRPSGRAEGSPGDERLQVRF